MSTGILNTIKQASLDAMENAQMCDLRYGTVVSVSPLKVQITPQFTIPESLLVVPQHLTNYKLDCTFAGTSQSMSFETNKTEAFNNLQGFGDTNEEKAIKDHTHKFNMNVSSDGGRQTITVHNGLKVNDKVALLRKQGGQSYFILDRI